MSGRASVEDCARFYLDRGVGTCVLTLGAEGAYYASRDGTAFRSPPFRIDVVDTTGCGDAFDAGIITALRRGMDPETAVRFAQAAPRGSSPRGSARTQGSAPSTTRSTA